MKVWTASAAIVLVFIASLFFLNRLGVSSRQYHEPYGLTEDGLDVYFVNTSPEVYSLWKEHGVRGRVVVHMGSFLHFVGIDDTGIYEGRGRFPVETVSILGEYEKDLGDENFLWVAMHAGIARGIYNVLPQTVFNEKLSAAAGLSGVAVSEDKIVTHLWGSRRTITGSMPAVREPVLLNVHASLFSHIEPAELLSILKESGIRTDMLTFCLAEDNTSVTEPERERLREFYRLVKGQ